MFLLLYNLKFRVSNPFYATMFDASNLNLHDAPRYCARLITLRRDGLDQRSIRHKSYQNSFSTVTSVDPFITNLNGVYYG